MKISSSIPKTLRDWCKAHPDKIRDIDFGGGYYTDRATDTAYDVLLARGWCYPEPGCHTIIEPTVRDMLRALRAIAPCDCPDCVTGQGWADRSG